MFRAIHIFGPMAGDANDAMMASATIPARLWYAPIPPDAGIHPPFPNGYMMVGHTLPPEVPWPGQVEYKLDTARSTMAVVERPSRVEGTAVYVLVDDG